MYSLLLLLCSTLLVADVVTPALSSLSTSMFSNSVESDFLFLRYIPIVSGTGEKFSWGVYAAEAFQPGQFICQPRGHLIPAENASHFDLRAILTYSMSTPQQVNAEGMLTEEQQQYILVDNTICSRIRFCFPGTDMDDESVSTCGNSVLISIADTGFLVVKALKEVPVGAEIIVELRSFYNIDPDHFSEQCHFDPHGCGISSGGKIPPTALGVASSESFALYLAPSSIPGVGTGLFTKFSIPPYNIITPCQGKVYHLAYTADADKPERLTAPLLTHAGTVVTQMDNFCGFANDIVDISFMDNFSYTTEDMQKSDSVPRLAGYQYNALQAGVEYMMPMLVSTTHIPAHTEVFQPYGESYWWYRYVRRRLVKQEEKPDILSDEP